MKFRFDYKTYQDVRHNTFLYFLPVIYILSLLFYIWVLPISWKNEIDEFISDIIIKNPNIKFWIKGLSIISIFTIVSYLLIEVFKVHDHFYDRYIIRWRKYYDRDFILPRLCKPFLSETNSDRFFEEANLYRSKFMQELYYPFVGDEHEKINKNTRVRFYEVITVYWFTQINEFIFIIIFLVLNITALVTQNPELTSNLPGYYTVLIILTALNWLWKRANNPKVEKATIAQINEIHQTPALYQEFKDKFTRLCKSYNIPFNE